MLSKFRVVLSHIPPKDETRLLMDTATPSFRCGLVGMSKTATGAIALGLSWY